VVLVPVKSKPRIVVLNPFPVYPPISGGQGRVFHLYKYVAHSFDIVILCFSDRRSYKVIAPGLQQIQIPKSYPHCQMEFELFRETGFVTCAITPKAASLTPEYDHVVKEQAKNADIVILSHPYLYKEAEELGDGRITVYDAHNVEYDLHRQILPASRSFLLEDIRQAEKAACEQSQLIATCSQEDAGKLACLYNISHNKFIIVPNGADVEAIPFVSYEQRKYHKAAQNMTQPCAVYTGSNFPPNIKAAEQVIELAKELPDVKFLLMGNLCEAFTGRKLSGNVALLGIVTEQEKYRVFSLADVALNPVQSGSGTNLKMLEYMAAGLPVITTLLGSRGIGGNDGEHFLVSEYAKMTDCISNLLNNPSLAASLAHHAYLLTKSRFDWKQIAASFVNTLSTAMR
jgi:glycosyltransferase involved in cell wall biosynthesis